MEQRTVMYALRGVSRECPENTLAAIRAAICQGYDGVVLDVQVTADGVPVLDRKHDVSKLFWEQVRHIEVGDGFARRFRGERIPALSEALVLTEAAGMKVCLLPDRVPEDRLQAVISVIKGSALCSLGAPPADAVCTTGKEKPDIRRGFRTDIHMHSEYSKDSTCPVADILTCAGEKDFDLICITDHCDLYQQQDEEALLAHRKRTVTEIRQKTEQSSAPEVLVGVELAGGFIQPELADRIAAAENYDMVIGSVHRVMFRGEWASTSQYDFPGMDDAAVLEYLDAYLESLLFTVEKMDVDNLAHLTYPLRYINGKYKRNVDWRVRENEFRRIFAAIIQRGIPLEINTSCRGSFYDEWLPAREIVDIYIEMGGYLFTFGSDAHVSSRVGSYYDEVADYLRSKGIRYLIYFKNRIAHQYSI